MVTMQRVKLEEIKAKLSMWIRNLEGGGVMYLVTRRGEVVAALISKRELNRLTGLERRTQIPGEQDKPFVDVTYEPVEGA